MSHDLGPISMDFVQLKKKTKSPKICIIERAINVFKKKINLEIQRMNFQ